MSGSEERQTTTTTMSFIDIENTEANKSAESGNDGGNVTDPPKAAHAAVNSRTCGVCLKNPAKYKCTRCELPYCSIPCNVEHKNNHPPDPPKAEPPSVIDSDSLPVSVPANGWNSLPRAGTQVAAGRPANILAPLLASPEVKTLFNHYPSLKAQLRHIYNTSQPPPEDNWEAQRERPFWTREQATRDGVEALKNAKKQYGKDGEGMREFAALVIRYISPEHVVNGSFDQQAPIYKETQEDNAKMISDLLRGELGN